MTELDTSTILDPDALKYVLSTPRGRKVIWGLLGAAGVFQQPFNTDSRVTDFNCGRLNQGLILWADCLTVDPDLTAMMIKEQGNDDNSSTRREHDADNASEPRSGRRKPSERSAPASELPAGLGLDRLTGRAIGDRSGNGDSVGD